MNKKSLIGIFVLITLLILSGCGGPQSQGTGNTSAPQEQQTSNKPATPARLLLGTSSVGGTYYVWGGGWAKIMNSKVPGVDISVEVTGGPTSNMQLIQDGQMELGFVTGFLAAEGYNGEGWAKEQGKKFDEMRAIFPMYSSVLHIYSIQGKGITSIYDFKGKHVSVGAPGSTSDIAGRAILKVLGIEPREISSLPTGAAVDGLRDGTIDAGFAVTGVPGPFMLDLETTHKVQHIGLSKEDMAKILKELPYSEGVIPKGTYKHQTEDTPVITFWNFAVADKDLPEDLIYNLVKATFENQADLIAVDPTAKQTVAENIKYSPIPLHPGALKYYKEIGIAIDSKLVPPEVK